MKRRLQWFCSCALLCALLVTAALPAPAAAASTGFSDVPESHWAADSIRRAVDLGLFQGQTPTRFGLGAPMTRGAFVVALCRLFGWEMVTPEAGSYTDNQDKSAWYYSAVETAYANGAITRQTDTFRPREPITREELAVMLVRAMGYGTIAGLAQDLPMPFRDVTTNVGYIAMAHELGLVNGTAATTFSPDQTATREQAAVMLIRLYDSYHAAAPEKTGIAYSAEGLTDLTGYGAVAVGGARLIYAGESRLAGTPDAETAAALQETITAAGAVPLLHVGGSASALKDDPSHTAEVLAAAVESGGYEGLFLDLAELSSAQKKDFTALAEALRAELGEDRLLPRSSSCCPPPRRKITTPTATPAPISPPAAGTPRCGISTARPPWSGPGWLLSSAWTSCASATCPLWRTMIITICWRGWTPDPPRCKSET